MFGTELNDIVLGIILRLQKKPRKLKKSAQTPMPAWRNLMIEPWPKDEILENVC